MPENMILLGKRIRHLRKARSMTQEELAVVDNAGRLQIPREYLGAIGISGKSKVRVELEDDKVVIINPDFHSGT